MLPFRPRGTGTAAFTAFCDRFIRVPKGTGARKPLRLRDWQRELVGSVLDADPQPRIAGWCLPRGQGKSTLVAALGLYELMTGGEGATVIVAAVDERQAGIVFGIARRMVELHPDLENRIQVFKDRLVVPSRGASFTCLPASPASLEGLDYTMGIADEIGRINRETWEVLALASGKRERSTLIGIGTPGPTEDNVLASLRDYSLTHPWDTSQVYREYSAAGFEAHPVDCGHCWELANPALDDYLHRDAMRALLPPKMSEGAFRRARLAQHVTGSDEPFITADVWDGLNTETGVPHGSDVVIGLDGSHNQDCTALVIGEIGPTPHFDKLAIWKNDGTPGWQVPVLDVEEAIRQARSLWNVKELIADPFRWTRSLQVLAGEGMVVHEFPWQGVSRVTKATTELHGALLNGNLTHSGDLELRSHVLNATIVETDLGLKISKASRSRKAGKIDLAAALLMCHSRCVWLGNKPKKKARAYSF